MDARFSVLICGYIRAHENNLALSYHVPEPIKEIIFLFYPKRCTVHGIGANEYNELGEEDTVESFKQLSAFSTLTFNPNCIYFGCYRFVIKTTDNKLYSIGKNSCGDCGIGKNTSRISTFTRINMLNAYIENTETTHYIDCVSNGANHMFFVMNNILYATGSNEEGQLGNSETTSFGYRIPIKIENNFTNKDDKIIQVECGYFHTLFLSDKGKLFACGKNSKGQCGMNRDFNHFILKPTRVECDMVIQKIYVGAKHNLCLSKNNKLVVFGHNSHNQCGIYSKSCTLIRRPKINPYFRKKDVIFVGTKHYHSLCIDKNGVLYMFGRNSKYQVSKKKKMRRICVFQKVYNEFKFTKIEQGSTGFDHTILLTRENIVIGFGANDYKQSNPSSNSKIVKDPHMFTLKEMNIDGGITRVIAAERSTIITVGL